MLGGYYFALKKGCSMIEASFDGMAIFAFFAALSTLSGIVISRRLNWRADAPSIMPIVFGAALGPFLLGIASIISLTVAGGKSGMAHLAIVSVVVGFPLLLPAGVSKRTGSVRECWSFSDYALVPALAAVIAALLLISIFIPLTQNDSLEYASAARVMFENNWIGSYPVLDPEANTSGFYGPWTHPPLYVALIYIVDVMQGHSDAPGPP